MSLFTATLLTALILILVGAVFTWNGAPVASIAKKLPRSKRFTLITFGIGSAWFLYKVMHLGEADFGSYSNILLIAFGAISFFSYFFVPDFLAVRGATIIGLLGSSALLDSAFAQYDIPARLFLVAFAYLVICLCIYLAVSPFRVRDFFDWLFKAPIRPKLFGGAILLYGLVLTGVAFTY